jgi:hypothetical protein
VPPVGAAPDASTPAESQGIRDLRQAYNDLKQRTGWAAELDPRQATEAWQFFQNFTRDPLAFYRHLQQSLQGDPEYAKEFPSNQPAEDPEPQADLQTEDGRHKVYSATQLAKWHEWSKRQGTKAIDDRLAPIQQFVTNAQTETRRQEVIAHARETTERVMTDLRQDPYFPKDEAGEAEIAKRLRAMSPMARRELGAVGALHAAFNQYKREVVYPNIDKEAERRADERSRQKAAAGAGGIKPSGGSGSQTVKRPSNPKELAAHLEAMSRQG